jgi:DNA mismatch repair protein MutL
VYSRIAAGEVVERPVSVVKETVENALDAGATEISVALHEGGKLRIVIEDNGEGMSFDDLPLAVARHATSKIRTVEELETVRSLGFRGEALASIAAVSRLEIRSRKAGEEQGALLSIEGGRTLRHVSTPCRPGTRISVEDLFYTLPARRKFLKTAAAEARRVSALVRDLAVAYPAVAFLEQHDGKQVFSSPGDGDRESLLRAMWGDPRQAPRTSSGRALDTAFSGAELRTCEAAATNLSLECWWMPFPGKTRSSISTFVNGRTVTDSVIRGAVGALCRSLVGNWIFFFSLSPELLDANIHPAKAEVRFRYPGEVFDVVQQAVLTLSGKPQTIAPFSSQQRGYQGASSGSGQSWQRPGASGGELFNRVAEAPFRGETAVASPGAEESTLHFPAEPEHQGGEERDSVRLLGRMESGYVVFEDGDALAVMDPHAAHERIGYERARRLSKDSVTSQRCAVPLPLPPSFSMSVREHMEALEDIGFSFDEREGLLLLTVYPALQGGIGEDPVRLLRSVLLEWTEDRKSPLEDILWRKLATLACGLSVKLGDRLTASECLALWRGLMQCEQPWSCPHGRPTVLLLPRNKLESFFGRE